MAMRCDHCGKGIQIGHNVSHSKRRTRKVWKPNLQVLRYREFANVPRETVRLCVSCLRKAKEHMRKIAQKQVVSHIKAPAVSTTNL